MHYAHHHLKPVVRFKHGSHNLGLPHAYENGVEYEDETGYMGNAPQQINFPRKCYNGPNHWHLGWYSRTLELNFESDAPSPPTNVKLAAFVDYDMTSDEHYVIIKVGDVYLQYNRATKFNVDTSEMKDMVTITEFSNHKTNLVAGLNSQSRFWQSNDTQVMVEFCRRSDVSFKPNYIEISIGQTETDCGNAPTLQPSTSPTLHPPLLPTSTTLPTLTPSMVPTKYQNTSEAPTFLVETNPAPQRADTNGGKSQGPSKSPVTKISTIDIDPNVSQERDPREQDGPESVITIILTVVLGAFFVMIVLVLRRNRRLRKSKAEERSASEEDEAPKHNNLFVRCITRSESNDDIVHLTKSDSSSAESSPNTSIESFDEERCDNLEDGEVCEISVDEKPAQLPSATGLENVCRVQVVRDQSLVLHSLVKPRSALRVENGFLSHPKNSGHGVLSQDAVG